MSDFKIQLSDGWFIRDRFNMPEIWCTVDANSPRLEDDWLRIENNVELYGWFNTSKRRFVLHPTKEIPKKILIPFKLYSLNKIFHGGGMEDAGGC